MCVCVCVCVCVKERERGGRVLCNSVVVGAPRPERVWHGRAKDVAHTRAGDDLKHTPTHPHPQRELCECVCVREREMEERGRGRGRGKPVSVMWCVSTYILPSPYLHLSVIQA